MTRSRHNSKPNKMHDEVRASTDRNAIFAAALAPLRRAPQTERGYAADFRVLTAFLHGRGESEAIPVDPKLVAAFIAAESRPDQRPGQERPARALSTLHRRLAAIRWYHALDGQVDPTKDQSVRDALHEARVRLGHISVGTKHPLMRKDVDRILRQIPGDTHAGRRDRAVLLTALATTLRRSELVAVDVRDLRFVPEGMLVRVASTGDESLAIAHGAAPDRCAVHAMTAWLERAEIHDGPVFRRVRAGDNLTDERLSDKAVARIVKARAHEAGLDPRVLAAHSLRSGGVAAADAIRRDGRQLSRLSRFAGANAYGSYVRRHDAFADSVQILKSHSD